MLKPFLTTLALATALTSYQTPVRAQDSAISAKGDELVFDLGVGGRLQPAYAGANSYLLVPFPILHLSFLRIPGLGTIRDFDNPGVYFYPSFGFVGERSGKDSADLVGTNKVDWAVEFGAGLGYRNDRFRAFAEVRRGFNGHQGFVGQLGLDAIARPMEKVTLSAGPRLGFADGDYMKTYFGVTAAESGASGMAQHTPGGGLKDIGIAAKATYAWTENTSLHLNAGYSRLIADADKSPIVKRGSENQFTVGLGLSHRFSFDFDGQ